MASIQSKVLFALLKAINVKATIRKWVVAPPRPKGASTPPRNFFKKYQITQDIIQSRNVFTISPKNKSNNKHIFYLHGGAYLVHESGLHWKMLDKIMSKTKCTLSFLDYPLTPEHQHQESFRMVLTSYQKIFSPSEEKEIIIMGDSAGGGLGVALAQKIKQDEIVPKPNKLILLSPWLDMSMKTEISEKLASKDIMIEKEVLQRAGDLYAGTHDKNDYLLSPINGEVNGIGKIALFIGTAEIMHLDAGIFADKVKKEGGDIRMFEYEDMQHIWPILPIPEGKKAIQEICEYVQSN